ARRRRRRVRARSPSRRKRRSRARFVAARWRRNRCRNRSLVPRCSSVPDGRRNRIRAHRAWSAEQWRWRMIRSHLLPRLGGFIGGRWRESRERFPVINPFDGETLAEVSSMGPTETSSAVHEAEVALARPLSLQERRRLLSDLASAIREEREEIGRIITLENGKPLPEGVAEAEYAAGFYE